jgi:hypothetical protein
MRVFRGQYEGGAHHITTNVAGSPIQKRQYHFRVPHPENENLMREVPKTPHVFSAKPPDTDVSKVKTKECATQTLNLSKKPKPPLKEQPAISPQHPNYTTVEIKPIFPTLNTEQKGKLERPATQPRMVPFGKEVIVRVAGKEIEALTKGVDFTSSPVVVDKNQNLHVVKGEQKEKLYIQNKHSVYDHLTPDQIYQPNKKFIHFVNLALNKKILGNSAAADFLKVLHETGHEVFIFGGAIRDLIYALHVNPNLSEEEAMKILNDIDLTCVGSPEEMRKIINTFKAKEGCNIEEVQGSGMLHAKMPGKAEGLDLNCMKVAGHFSSVKHPEMSNLPFVVFGGNIARESNSHDFAANSLFYDPLNQVIVDPSKMGVVDAQSKTLRLLGNPDDLVMGYKEAIAHRNNGLYRRMIKFILRDYHTNSFTANLLLQNGVERLNTFKTEGRDEEILWDIACSTDCQKLMGKPPEEVRVEVKKKLEKLEKKLSELNDVAGFDFRIAEEFIRPMNQEIIGFCVDQFARKI